MGAITAGAIGWITLAFWIHDSIYTVSGNPLIASSFSMEVIIRNSIGIFIAGLVVASSHNVFHKIYGLRNKANINPVESYSGDVY